MIALTTVLLTGISGAGKTSTASRLVKAWGAGVAGVLSDSILHNGTRRAIVARLLPDGEEVALAHRARPDAPPPGTAHPSFAAAVDDSGRAVVCLGPWDFSVRGIDLVNRHLRRLADAQPSDVRPYAMLIDEIGPLELVHGGGFLPGLRAVATAAVSSVIVVRPSLVDSLRAFLATCRRPDAAGRVVVVEIADPSESPRVCDTIQAMLDGPDVT